MSSEYRGEVRPRRSPVRHHFVSAAATHDTREVLDPFPPLSTKQFPAMYTRSPTKYAYRAYMRSKAPYLRPRM